MRVYYFGSNCLIKSCLLCDTGKLCSKFGDRSTGSIHNVTILSTDAGRTDGRLRDFIFCPMHMHCIWQTTSLFFTQIVTQQVINYPMHLLRCLSDCCFCRSLNWMHCKVKEQISFKVLVLNNFCLICKVFTRGRRMTAWCQWPGSISSIDNQSINQSSLIQAAWPIRREDTHMKKHCYNTVTKIQWGRQNFISGPKAALRLFSVSVFF